ncbi:MAG: TldD/PmbA family protein [Chloroflexota bacterium]|nr:TldD/PmbA family protein [Chloroflexota bacterium]
MPAHVGELLERTLRHSDADQTEVLYLAQDDALTRFANSQIHQNVAEHDRSVQVRVIHEQRTGVASTNRLDEASLRAVVERAIEISRLAAPNANAPRLPEPGGEHDPELGYVARTAEADPQERGRGAQAVIAAGEPHGLTVSGSFATGTSTVAVANSHGVRRYHRSTRAALVTVMLDGAATGYANAGSTDVADIDTEALGREAADKAVRSRGAEELEPGEYEVVLEEYAVATVLEYLSFIGFSGLAYQEDRSFMELGKQVMGENVSIWDDGCDPSGIPSPIDYEGAAKQRVDLIERGVARAVVHDAATAHRAGVPSTGHGLPAPNVYGPFAWNLFMAPGESSKDEMLSSMARGIWVTRFHYVNPVHPKKAVLTGMTKDGTFLVENGRFVKPILNFRFTQAILEAFSDMQAISRQTRLLPGDFVGAIRAPAVKIGRFNFTGVTRRDG